MTPKKKKKKKNPREYGELLTKTEEEICRLKRDIAEHKKKSINVEQDLEMFKDVESREKDIKLLSCEVDARKNEIIEINKQYDVCLDHFEKQKSRLCTMKQQFAEFQRNHDQVLNGWNQKRKDWELQEKKHEEENKKLLQNIADMTGKVSNQTDILEKVKDEQKTINVRCTFLHHKIELS